MRNRILYGAFDKHTMLANPLVFEIVRHYDNLAMSRNQIITRSPDVLGGTPVFTGTRVPFETLLDYLEGGQTLAEFLDDFPTVTREAAVQALEQAKSLLVDQLR